MPRVRIPVRFRKDGTITATIAPEDVPVALDKVIALARRAARDGIVTHRVCIPADERHAMAARVAELLLQEAGLL